jgi:hypothetical protein
MPRNLDCQYTDRSLFHPAPRGIEHLAGGNLSMAQVTRRRVIALAITG